MGTHPIFESDFDCLTEMGIISIAVRPTSLSFTTDKAKDVLTLYNQNAFSVKFKVMSTIQDGFDMSLYRGELAPESRLDIAVRAKKAALLAIEPSKIRIEYVSTVDRKVRQHKDIAITVAKPSVSVEQSNKLKRSEPLVDDQRDMNGSYYLFIVAVCLAILADSEYLPDFTHSHKLIASYVMGMMTILLIKLA